MLLLYQKMPSFTFDMIALSKNQSHYRPEVPRGFQEVKVPRLRDNDPEW